MNSTSRILHHPLPHLALILHRVGRLPVHVLLVLRIEPLLAVITAVDVLAGVVNRHVLPHMVRPLEPFAAHFTREPTFRVRPLLVTVQGILVADLFAANVTRQREFRLDVHPAHVFREAVLVGEPDGAHAALDLAVETRSEVVLHVGIEALLGPEDPGADVTNVLLAVAVHSDEVLLEGTLGCEDFRALRTGNRAMGDHDVSVEVSFRYERFEAGFALEMTIFLRRVDFFGVLLEDLARAVAFVADCAVECVRIEVQLDVLDHPALFEDLLVTALEITLLVVDVLVVLPKFREILQRFCA